MMHQLIWIYHYARCDDQIQTESCSVMPEGEKLWGGASGNGGHNLPTPGLNRVN